MDKKILVTIDPMGNPKIEAQNFNGMGCEQATGPIENALRGAGGVDRVLKPEWHNANDQQEGVHQTQW